MKFTPLRALAVVGAALVLMIGGAVAFASIPAANGTITACMVKSSGTIRLIDSGSCRTGEQKVTWNQAGQPGTPGTNGTNGVSGFEVVQVRNSARGNDNLGFIENIRCPVGKAMLGLTGSADLIIGGSVAAPAALDKTFISYDPGANQYTGVLVFAKANGTFIFANEEIHWTAQATCAAVAP